MNDLVYSHGGILGDVIIVIAVVILGHRLTKKKRDLEKARTDLERLKAAAREGKGGEMEQVLRQEAEIEQASLRPPSVTALGVLQTILGCLWLLRALFGVASGMSNQVESCKLIVLATACLPFGVLLVAAGIGLCELKHWARVASLWIAGFSLLVDFLILFSVWRLSSGSQLQDFNLLSVVGAILRVLFFTLMLIVLLRRNVATLFEPARRTRLVTGLALVICMLSFFGRTIVRSSSMSRTSPSSTPSPFPGFATPDFPWGPTPLRPPGMPEFPEGTNVPGPQSPLTPGQPPMPFGQRVPGLPEGFTVVPGQKAPSASGQPPTRSNPGRPQAPAKSGT